MPSLFFVRPPVRLFAIILAINVAFITVAHAQTENVLYDFPNGTADGFFPSSTLIFDGEGNLYGTTVYGGIDNCRNAGYGCGAIFELTPNGAGGWSYTVLYAFAGNGNGGEPFAGLVLDAAGNLYGTAYIGGARSTACPQGCGVVFRLAPSEGGAWKYTVLHAFHGVDGAFPLAGVVLDNSGNVYGTTSSGGASGTGGVAFKLSPNSNGGWQETLMHSFTNGADGGEPNGLIMDVSGNFYGTTTLGGGGTQSYCSVTGCGVVFRLAPATGGGWRESILHTFTGGSDGGRPASSLTSDRLGNLYGTTDGGGDLQCLVNFGCGTVFKLSPSGTGWIGSVLHAFKADGKDGEAPQAAVTLDAVGNVYGTTTSGGTGGGFGGTAFELSRSGSGWDEKILYTFNGPGGSFPYSGVLLDSLGNLYGDTTQGGPSGCFTSCGVVYEITP